MQIKPNTDKAAAIAPPTTGVLAPVCNRNLIATVTGASVENT